MGRLIVFIGWTIFCIVVALIPEIVMYSLWHLVSPEGDDMRLLLIFIFFWFGGIVFSILFGFLGFMLWGIGLSNL